MVARFSKSSRLSNERMLAAPRASDCQVVPQRYPNQFTCNHLPTSNAFQRQKTRCFLICPCDRASKPTTLMVSLVKPIMLPKILVALLGILAPVSWSLPSQSPACISPQQLAEFPAAKPLKTLSKRTHALRLLNKLPNQDQHPGVQPVLPEIEAVAVLSKLAAAYEMYRPELEEYRAFESELRRKFCDPNLQSDNHKTLERSQVIFAEEVERADVHGRFPCQAQ